MSGLMSNSAKCPSRCMARCDTRTAERRLASLSRLRARIFREDLLGPLESLVDRLLRGHPVVHDIEHGDAEDVLGVDLRHRRVECLIEWHRRMGQRLLGKSGAVRVLMEPERVSFRDFGHWNYPTSN